MLFEMTLTLLVAVAGLLLLVLLVALIDLVSAAAGYLRARTPEKRRGFWTGRPLDEPTP